MLLLFIPLWIIFGDVAQSLVDFGDDPIALNVAMSDITVQITITAPGDPNPDQARFVTVMGHGNDSGNKGTLLNPTC